MQEKTAGKNGRGQPGGARALAAALAAGLVFFALLTIVAYGGCQYVLTHSAFRLSRIASGGLHVDILVAGDSRGANLVAGSAGRPSIFNLSFNNQGPAVQFALIRSFFERGNTARTVVFESSTLFVKSPSCGGKTYWFLYPELYRTQYAKCPGDALAARYFPLTAFNGELFLRALYYLLAARHGDQDWANDYSIPKELCARLPLQPLYSARAAADSADIDKLKSDVAAMRAWLAQHAHGAKLVFVLGPYFVDARSLPLIAEIRKRNALVLGAGNFLDLSTALGPGCGNYADALHANRAGRAKILPAILNDLARQGR